MDLLEQTILQFLPGRHRKTSKCISINCPCCVYMGEPRPDMKMRGGIFLEMDHLGYNCFNCGFKVRQPYNEALKGKTKKFLQLMGVPREEINKLQLESMKKAHTTSLFLGIEPELETKKKTLDLNFQDCELPKDTYLLHDIIMDCDPSSEAFDAYNYAQDRGIAHWPYIMWSSTTHQKMNKRLIIPYMFKERVVGYTARAFVDVKKQERYVTKNPNTGKYLFNVSNIFKSRKYLIVNESPIDSIIYDGVATMNFEPTYKQIDLINASKAKPIVVPDMNVSGRKIIDVAIKNNWGVFFPFWNNEFDLGKATSIFGKLFVLQNIIEKHDTSPIKIKVRANMKS